MTTRSMRGLAVNLALSFGALGFVGAAIATVYVLRTDDAPVPIDDDVADPAPFGGPADARVDDAPPPPTVDGPGGDGRVVGPPGAVPGVVGAPGMGGAPPESAPAPTTELRTRLVNGQLVIESVEVAPPAPLPTTPSARGAPVDADPPEGPDAPGEVDDDERIAQLSKRAGLEARERCELARLLTARAATLLLEGGREQALKDSKQAMDACGEDGQVAASRARLLALAADSALDESAKRALLEESVRIADDAHVLRALADVVERQGDAARAAALRQQAGGTPRRRRRRRKDRTPHAGVSFRSPNGSKKRPGLIALVALVVINVGAAACKRPAPPAPTTAAPVPAVVAAPAPPAPGPVEAARVKAATLAKAGDVDAAIALLETTRVHFVDDAALSCDLGHLYNDRAVTLVATDVDRAEKVARTARLLCPTDVALAKNLARILARRATDMDDEVRRKDLLEQSLALEEQSGVLVGLAEIAFRQNDPKAAVAYYERARTLEPENARLGQRLDEVRKQAAVEGSFADARHDHFVARFEGSAQEKLAWQTLDVLEQAYFRIGDALSLHPADRLTVVIYTGAQYEAAIDVPDWSAGAFDGKIRVRQGDIAAANGDLVDLLFHEYVHALLVTTVKGRVPAWFHEGLAQRLEPSGDAPTVDLARAKEGGTLPSLDELDGSFTSIKDPERARTAYATARAIVDAMADARGGYSLAQLLATMNQGRTFEEAFASTYATDLATFAVRWRDRL